MAEIKEGILGGVHGKVGTVVGFMWRGRYYLRGLPRRSNKPASDKQILCRSKFGIVSTFASKFGEFVNRHCPPALLNGKMAPGKEQLISMLAKEGVVIIDGIPCIDISAVILSIGALPPAVIKKINVLKTGRVKVAWDNNITNLMTKGTDRLTLVAYHENYGEPIEIESIGKREDKFVHFDLPEAWTTGNVHFWSVWKSADGTLISTSAYHGIVSLGEVPVEEEIKADCEAALSDDSVIAEEKEPDCEVALSDDSVVAEEIGTDCKATLSDDSAIVEEIGTDCEVALSDDSVVAEEDEPDYKSTLLDDNVIAKENKEEAIRSKSSKENKVEVSYGPRSVLEALLPTDKDKMEEEILDE